MAKKRVNGKSFEAREIRGVFDAEAAAVKDAELHGARLQAALTETQSELKSCIERAASAETRLEEAVSKDKSKGAAG